MPAMNRLQEFVSEARRQLRGASTKWKAPVYVVLVATSAVGIEELWKAYQARSVADAIASAVGWFIICPAFTLWLYRRNSD
jgi:hypothetical protein